MDRTEDEKDFEVLKNFEYIRRSIKKQTEGKGKKKEPKKKESKG